MYSPLIMEIWIELAVRERLSDDHAAVARRLSEIARAEKTIARLQAELADAPQGHREWRLHQDSGRVVRT